MSEVRASEVTASMDGLQRLWTSQALTGATSDMVYHVLREALITRVVPPGDRLPEEHLARVFQVSRTPVREALFRLEAEGLAQRIPRRGLVAPHVTPREILDVYVVRESLDGLAAWLAAGVATPADLATLTALNDEFAALATGDDLRGMAEANLVFHEAVARAAGNAVLLDLLQQIHHRVRRFSGTTFSRPGRPETAAAEHRHLIDAIGARRPELAREIATAHMATAREIRIAMLQAEPDGA